MSPLHYGHGTIARAIAVVVLACAFAPDRAAAAPSDYVYVSPAPGSRLVSPYNNVVIRYGPALDVATVDLARLAVTGARTGEHPGRLELADDGRTLVFEPAAPLAAGETVAVTLAPGIRTSAGAPLPALAFAFVTSAREPALRASLAREACTDGAAGPSRATPAPGARAATTAADLPPGFPEITILACNDPDSGYVFVSPRSDQSHAPLLIIDNHAMPIFYRRAPYELLDFKRQPNGLLTYYDYNRYKFYALDSTYAVVDSFAAGNGYRADFHDIQLLPNGHVLLIIYDDEPIPMDTIVPGGDPEATVAGLIVQELDTRKRVVFQWRSWDHFEITDAVDVDLTASFIDYVHCNAVELDQDGNLLISSRHLNEVTKIDRQSGAVLWRLGRNAKHNQFQFVGDPRGFAYQHDIRRLPDGHVTLFDNGNFLSPQTSRAVEYALDEQRKVATLVWEASPDVPGWANSNGSVQRRPNGDTMVGWGAGVIDPEVTEFHADGTKAFELALVATTYRAFRQPWESRRFITNVDRIDFGATRRGTAVTQPLAITNRTKKPVTLTHFLCLDPAAFRVTNTTPLTLGPQATVIVDVEFAPDSLGPFGTTLYIRSQTDTEIIARAVRLDGTGVPVEPTVHVQSPNGGETYVCGGTLDFTWAASGGVGTSTVDVALSRNGPDGPFETIATGVPNTGRYVWSVAPPETFAAYLRVVARDAADSTGSDVSDTAFAILPHNTAVDGPAPESFALSAPWPDPAHGTVWIEYTVASAAPVRLTVLDVHGRRVATLAEGVRTSGRYVAAWNGLAGGRRAPAGVYFVRYEAGGRSLVRRIVRAR